MKKIRLPLNYQYYILKFSTMSLIKKNAEKKRFEKSLILTLWSVARQNPFTSFILLDISIKKIIINKFVT